jgi:large subunit ribosomal protein L3
MKIFARKLKMVQIWKNDTVIPVTVLKVESENKKLPEDIKEGIGVKISGKSKGKGFQGVVKRHGFAGGPETHGQKDRLRAPGSIGPTAPQRTIKGRKMAGHMGQRRITAKNMEVVAVNSGDQTILVKGAVPGMRGTIVELITNN